jgi:RNA polymerase sigma factor (sigma-70 family)
VDYIYHPSFDDPDQEAEILAPMPSAEAFEAQLRQWKVPDHVPPELAPLYTPLLNKEQEQHLFRKMNYLKHKAVRLGSLPRIPRGGIDAIEARTQDLHLIENLQRQAQALRAQLINCNTGLLVSIAKRHAARNDNFHELLSDGYLSLMSAVDKFDYSRGNKFSTYASWVIMRNYTSSNAREKNRHMLYRTGHTGWLYESVADPRIDEQVSLTAAEQARDDVNRLLDFLEPREQQILRLRTGLDGAPNPLTLEKIGLLFGISKERVRQVQLRAIRKLRNFALAHNIALP